MPLQTLNGAQVNIEDTGGEGPTVVFGHGLLFSGLMFDAQVERLRDRYRCVTIDWRGQGRSKPAPDGAYDMDTLTADAVALIEGLDVGPVHWVGLSMGGFVGMRLAARRPELLRSLTLLDTSAGPEDPEKISQYRLLSRIYRLVGMRPVRSKVQPIMFGPTFLASPDSADELTRFMEVIAGCDRAGMAGAIRGVFEREPVYDLLETVAAPTLVVVGAEDVATPPAKAEVIAHGIEGARYEIVDGAGHSSTVEQPVRLSDLVEEHVTSHS